MTCPYVAKKIQIVLADLNTKNKSPIEITKMLHSYHALLPRRLGHCCFFRMRLLQLLLMPHYAAVPL